MKFTHIIYASLISLLGAGCAENASIGSSIVQDNVKIVIDSVFTISGHSVEVTSIPARSDNQLLGRFESTDFGEMSSDFVTQFMPANRIYTDGVTADNVDSIKLRMFMIEGNFVGDSVAPLGLEVYRLTKALPTDINSDFDPTDYYDSPENIASKIYTATVMGLPDSVADVYTEEGIRVVDVKMPDEMGKEFFNKYISDGGVELFNDPVAFAKWFPGLYVKNSFGSGRIMRFYATRMYMYMHKVEQVEVEEDDTTVLQDTTLYSVSSFLAVTPEVINNNNIKVNLSDEIRQLAAEKPIAVAPIGYDTEVTIPIQDIVDQYKAQAGSNNVINTMTFEIPAVAIENEYDIDVPQYMLLVKKSERESFFEDSDLTDNVTSFYATYDSTNECYTFSGMRQLVIDAIAKDSSEGLDASDGEYVLTPVSLVTETTQSSYYSTTTTVVAITPYIDTPAMAEFDFDNAKIKVTYSTQSAAN